MNKLLSGKITLVSGAGQSMSASVIRRFLEEEATVLVPAKSMSELNRLRTALAGVDTKGLITMLMDYPDYYKAFEAAGIMMERFGKIDLAVFCFDNLFETATLAETDIIDWERMIDEQVTAYFVGARILLSTMRDQQQGMFIGMADTGSSGRVHNSALSALAQNIQQQMAAMFGAAAERHHIKWYHIALTHDAGENPGNNANVPPSPGDCIISLYRGEVSNTTGIFQSFSIPGSAPAPATAALR